MIENISGLTGLKKVRGYTKKEKLEKLKALDRSENERAELRLYLSQFPNPDHLTFDELVDLYAAGKKPGEEDEDYILDIGHYALSDDDSIIVDIKEKTE